jgi:serine/threonine-protein kinase ULK2
LRLLCPEITTARRRPHLERRLPPSPLSEPALLPPESPVSPANTTFPPPPNPNAPPLSSSPSSAASRTNALTRALNLASKKLFGSSSRRPSYSADSSPSPRRQQIITGRGEDEDVERDPMEDDLLTDLEQLAQKTDVLRRWADEMYETVKAVPQSASSLCCMPIHVAFNLHPL